MATVAHALDIVVFAMATAGSLEVMAERRHAMSAMAGKPPCATCATAPASGWGATSALAQAQCVAFATAMAGSLGVMAERRHATPAMVEPEPSRATNVQALVTSLGISCVATAAKVGAVCHVRSAMASADSMQHRV